MRGFATDTKILESGLLGTVGIQNSYIGTPQGGIISPILANVYLDKLDKFMLRYIETFNKGKDGNATLNTRGLPVVKTNE